MADLTSESRVWFPSFPVIIYHWLGSWTCHWAEHASPCTRREDLLLPDGEDGGWGDEEQVSPGGLRDGDHWQLQVSSSFLPLSVWPTSESDGTSCLCAPQPHVDRRPPAPAAHHCSKWSSCGLVWQGVQDPFRRVIPRLRDVAERRFSCRGDSSAEGLFKTQASKAPFLGEGDYQPSITASWSPPGLGSHGGPSQRCRAAWQSLLATCGSSTFRRSKAEQCNVGRKKRTCCRGFCS